MLVPVINLSLYTPQKRAECWIEGLYTSTNTLQRSLCTRPLFRNQIVRYKKKIDYTASMYMDVYEFLFINVNSVQSVCPVNDSAAKPDSSLNFDSYFKGIGRTFSLILRWRWEIMSVCWAVCSSPDRRYS